MTRDSSGLERIPEAFVADVLGRLADHESLRRRLPDGGSLFFDRPLPFLCVYRRPWNRSDEGTAELIRGESSYLIAPGMARRRKDWTRLLHGLVSSLMDRFGDFLVVEIWSAPPSRPRAGASEMAEDEENRQLAALRPKFRVTARGPNKPRAVVEMLIRSLRQIVVDGVQAEVEMDDRAEGRAPGMPSLFSTADAKELKCHFLGIEVKPVYRDVATEEVFPAALRVLRRGVSRALRRTFFTFVRTHTTARVRHSYALGRRALVKAVWEVDRRLAEVANAFDLVWQVTPINTVAAWREFQRSRFERTPEFRYRPLTVEPTELKRRLFSIPIEKIEDPTLSHLFLQSQDELDRKITMLADIGDYRLLAGSVQVYGLVEPKLLELAKELLRRISSRSRDQESGRTLNAEQFAELARAEIAWYRQKAPDFATTVTVCDDLYWGLSVSDGKLLIGCKTRIPPGRVGPLLQHEIGTHLVTYYNGQAQPFRQLYCGLAGYEAFQEGLAVLAEHLSHSIDPPRVRILAARVIACQALLEGASFVETFRTLNKDHGFSKRLAYTIAMRVYRGGGTVKDAIYLRGLVEVLQYLGDGGEFEPLLLGKIAADHIPLMRELKMRRVLVPPPLRPRYLDRPGVSDKLLRLREGLSVFDLFESRKKRK
ncbi:MAG: DUF1704 domain-containing protein [Pirellulales bacterium]|nr:DUF1704 domain-containing protein [Pirellulales bacterium]